MADPRINNWWEHWSVSGSVVIAAVSLGRDYCRDIGMVQNKMIYWYIFESIFLLVTVILMALKVKVNIFRDVGLQTIKAEDIDENKGSDESKMVSVETETKHRDYAESTEKMKSHYHVKMAKISKNIRQLRKHFASKIAKIKNSTTEVARTMSSIQLKVPSLTQENRFLTEENDVIQAQLLQEMEKQQDLNEKFQELHSYIRSQGQIAMNEPMVDLVQ